MAVLVLSSDPDFVALLTFLLRHHGIAVADAGLAGPPQGADPGLVLADLTDQEAVPRTAASAALYAGTCPLLVLSEPGVAALEARSILPNATAYLPVPLVPRAFIARVREILDPEAVAGYGSGRGSLAS